MTDEKSAFKVIVGTSSIKGEDDILKFDNMIKDEFSEVIKEFSLEIKKISESETIIFSEKYILSFEFHSSELDLSYIERIESGKLLQYYNFGSFVAFMTEPKERDIINAMNISELEKQIKIFENTLKNVFGDLLKGGNSWKEGYKKFVLFTLPRDVSNIKQSIYNGI